MSIPEVEEILSTLTKDYSFIIDSKYQGEVILTLYKNKTRYSGDRIAFDIISIEDHNILARFDIDDLNNTDTVVKELVDIYYDLLVSLKRNIKIDNFLEITENKTDDDN